MNIIRARQPVVTRVFPHNGNSRFVIPRAGVRPVAPVFTLPPGAYPTGTNIEITSPDGSPIYYSVTNLWPSDAVLYTGPIALLAEQTFYAACKRPGGLPSLPVSAAYTLTAPLDRVRWEFDTTLDGFFCPVGEGTIALGPPGQATGTGATAGFLTTQRNTVQNPQLGSIWRYITTNFDRVSDEVAIPNYQFIWTGDVDPGGGLVSQSLATIDGGTNYQLTWDMFVYGGGTLWKRNSIISFSLRWGTLATIGGHVYRLNWVEVGKDGSPPL